MYTLFIFIAILALLVISHEFGHFIAARRNGIKVNEFGFGFPPRLFGIQVFNTKKDDQNKEKNNIKMSENSSANILSEEISSELKEINVNTKRSWKIIWGNKNIEALLKEEKNQDWTIYSLNLIPIGGFVRIKGEDGQNKTDSDSFGYKKNWQKAIVLSAGVVMNVVLAGILLSVGYMVGLPQVVDDLPESSSIQERRLEIASVLPDKPAEKAGIQSGDIILSLDLLNKPRLKEMQNYIDEHRDDVLSVTIKRGEEIIVKDIKPITYEDTGRGGLGVAIAEIGIVKYPWYKAIYYGFVTSFIYLKAILTAFGAMIYGLFSGASVSGQLAGPVGIAVLTGKAAKLGLAYLIQFTAILSLNLALINILPIPAMDGGRLLFLLISKIRGKDVSQHVEQWIHAIGFFALLFLLIVVTVKDISTFGSAISGFFSRLF